MTVVAAVLVMPCKVTQCYTPWENKQTNKSSVNLTSFPQTTEQVHRIGMNSAKFKFKVQIPTTH